MTKVSYATDSELGKKTEYDSQYNPKKLFPISRVPNRQAIGVQEKWPYFGVDIWNHYEVSWLNEKGKPVVAIAEMMYGCETPNIIESKSLKLYFNSFNNTVFKDVQTVQQTIKKDLEASIGGPVEVNVFPLSVQRNETLSQVMQGDCIDEIDVSCTVYDIDPNFLQTENEVVEETLHSHLLKSNCLVTNQPDWGSVEISYRGKKINREGLLRYIVSFRNHNEFHEQCVERIFMDIMRQCQPEELTVYGRYTRRGGIDINPYRSTKKITAAIKNQRLSRQ